ncbi:hypothetical protein JCGZ_20475 [Jatropha curcas]|uniref:NAD-dependent epimerase/dehydratase domain-containing protein n=1 Tax=Jatropha curcas TaxID=180498 RepID=A0A067K0J7_JATCU|nr:putative anthocyanidin reductase [Jatropha curcas]KDP25319.1 hypothetical protein JCGZ_20475 [Jatropha curcas]
MERDTKVCVTGGSGYLGSWLVKKLLEKGYIVHATLRNLEDTSKTGLLKSLPKANTNLFLFQADLYKPIEFEKAIHGCQFVFHVATPLFHDPNKTSGNKDKVEAAVAGDKSIVETCIRSKSVKRLIYTASVLAASPLNEDGITFRSCMDESCWTPLHLSFPFGSQWLMDYVEGKTLAEKEVLSYNERDDDSKMEVVTLVCGLVGGETILSHVPRSVEAIYSQVKGSLENYNALRFLEQVIGLIPILHVDDVCEAHIFCMEKSSMEGRFICSATKTTSREIANYFSENYPEIKIDEEFMGESEREIILDTSKLTEMGFVYKYDLEKILDESLKFGRRVGDL